MPSICCIANCSNRANREGVRDNVRFFRFPTTNNRNPELKELVAKRRRAWLDAVNRSDLNEEKLQYTRVCSKHFISGRSASLCDDDSPDWVPSIALGYQSKNNSQKVTKRRNYQILMRNERLINDQNKKNTTLETTTTATENFNDEDKPIQIFLPKFESNEFESRARRSGYDLLVPMKKNALTDLDDNATGISKFINNSIETAKSSDNDMNIKSEIVTESASSASSTESPSSTESASSSSNRISKNKITKRNKSKTMSYFSKKQTKFRTAASRQKEKSDIDLFFESISKTIKKFPAYTAAAVKWEIGNIVARTELQLLEQQKQLIPINELQPQLTSSHRHRQQQHQPSHNNRSFPNTYQIQELAPSNIPYRIIMEPDQSDDVLYEAVEYLADED